MLTTNLQDHPIGKFDEANLNTKVEIGKTKALIGVRYDSNKKMDP